MNGFENQNGGQFSSSGLIVWCGACRTNHFIPTPESVHSLTSGPWASPRCVLIQEKSLEERVADLEKKIAEATK